MNNIKNETLITVLMTTYNESTDILQAAVDSILKQTIRNFDFLIIIDNPNNQEIIETVREYTKKDTRVKMLINEKNLGLPGALNRGIDVINTKYIARMDADDKSVENRLEKQLDFMQKHPDVDLIGTNITYISNDGEIMYKKGTIPTGYKYISKAMRYANIYNHPTLFGKTEIFKEFKYRNLRYSQDYDFTCRLLENGHKIDNLPDYLLYYRAPGAVKKEKMIRQKLTYGCVQNCYKKKNLTNTDINVMVEEKLSELDPDKFYKAIVAFNTATEDLKKKNYMCFIKKMFYSFFACGFTRSQIFNLVQYAFLKIENK